MNKKDEVRAARLISEFVFLLVVERHLIIQDIVEIFLHEHHRVSKPVLLVVSAVIHVGVVTKDETNPGESTGKEKSF